MNTFILVLFFHVGILADSNNLAAIYVPGFPTKAECIKAGEDSSTLVSTTKKSYRYVCLKQSKVKNQGL